MKGSAITAPLSEGPEMEQDWYLAFRFRHGGMSIYLLSCRSFWINGQYFDRTGSGSWFAESHRSKHMVFDISGFTR